MARIKSPVEGRPAGWEETIERFCTYLAEREKSPNTIRCYRNDLLLFGAWYQSEEHCEPELATIDASELRDWKTTMLENKHAPQSVNRRLATVQSLFKWAQFYDWCQPVLMPRTVRQEPPRPRWLTRPEENALVRAVKASGKQRAVALTTTLLHAGLRIAEAASSKWGDLDINPRSGSIAVIGKGRKHREIPLDSEARAALSAWEESEGGQTWAARLRADRYVFTGQRGPMEPMKPGSLGLIVSSYGPRVKLFDLTAHVLRHTCCRRWYEQGMDPIDIAKLAGHESLDTTRLYIDSGQSDLQAQVERRCGGQDDGPEPPRPGRRRR
jgi:site-specific recombinase XerD